MTLRLIGLGALVLATSACGDGGAGGDDLRSALIDVCVGFDQDERDCGCGADVMLTKLSADELRVVIATRTDPENVGELVRELSPNTQMSLRERVVGADDDAWGECSVNFLE